LLSAGEFAARLVSALGAALVIGATYQLGRVLLSRRAGLWSTILLASTSLMIIDGRFVRMDVWLTAFIAWGMLAFCRVHFANAHRGYLVLGYACLAAACLTKGLIGILLPCAAIGGFLLVRRDWSAIRRACPLSGMAIVVLLASPWFVYMTWRFPQYPGEFFLRHHFLRATTGTFGRSEIILFLPGVILAGFLPWTAFLLAALLKALPRAAHAGWPKPPGLALCLLWAGVAIVPFMFSRTQLPVYIVPAFPALALIAGWYVDGLLARGTQRETRWVFGLTLALMAMTLCALAVVNRCTFNDAPWLTAARRLAIFVPAVVLVAWLLRRPRVAAALTTTLLMTIALAVDAAWCEGPGMFAHYSSYQLIKTAAPQTDVKLLVMGPEPQYSVPFYLGQRTEVRHVAHIIDFQEYESYPAPILGLLTGNRAFAIVKGGVGDRLDLLARRGSLYLVKIRPRKPSDNIDQSHHTPSSHPQAASKSS